MTQISPADWMYLSLAVAVATAAGVVVGYRFRPVRSRREEADFFEQTRDAAIITENGVIIGANQAALGQFGYSREQFIGLPVMSLLVDPDDEKRFVRALIYGPLTDFELRLKTAAGDTRDCMVSASARFDGQGNVIGCRGLARDVTERNRIDGELRRAEQDYRGLFDNAYDAILILDRLDETVLDVNHQACLLYGIPREKFVGRSMADLSMHPSRGEMFLRQTREGGGRYAAFESQQLRGDGSIIDVEINAAEIQYKGRKVILSINRDISARRRAEEEIRESEARFRLLLESVTDYAIVMLDPAGRIVSWNEGAQRILGYTEEEVLGRSVSVFAPPAEADALAADLATAAANGRLERDAVRVRKDGSRFAASVTLTPMVDETQSLRGFAVVTRDVTERDQLEQARQDIVTALSDVAAEWTATFDGVQVPIVLIDRNGEIRRLNRAAQALTNRPFAEVIHKRAADLEEEPWTTIARVAHASFRTGRSRNERAKAGESVWQVSGRRAVSGGTDSRAIVVAYDISHVTQLEASLRHNEVAAAMGTMVAAVAHEVRNPLFTITATLDAWGARYGDTEGMTRYAGPLREQVERLNRLMTDLLDYGKPNPLSVRAASLGDAILAAAKDCAVVEAQSSARVDVDIEPQLPPAAIDRPRIEQVLQNVIDNALRHSPPGGAVRVEARLEGGDILCRVIDEGPGVSAEDLGSMFMPFFTRRRGGTGLGLAIARRIVNAHGGEIAFANREDGPGAIVTIRLPRSREGTSLRLEARAKAS